LSIVFTGLPAKHDPIAHHSLCVFDRQRKQILLSHS
jgi:hypothetical protein